MTTTDERLVLSVTEAGRLVGLGRSAAYDAIARGDLPYLRIGRRIVVPRRALEKLLENPNGWQRDTGVNGGN